MNHLFRTRCFDNCKERYIPASLSSFGFCIERLKASKLYLEVSEAFRLTAFLQRARVLAQNVTTALKLQQSFSVYGSNVASVDSKKRQI